MRKPLPLDEMIAEARELADGADAGRLLEARGLLGELADAVENLRSLTEPRLTALGMDDDGSLRMAFASGWVAMVTEHMGELFTSSGGKNVVVFSFEHKELGRLDMTIQRVQGKTPMDLYAETKAKLEAIRCHDCGGSLDAVECAECGGRVEV